MSVPEFDSIIDAWDEHLSVGLQSSGGEGIMVIEGEGHGGIPLLRMEDVVLSSAIVPWVAPFTELPYVHGYEYGGHINVKGAIANHMIMGNGLVSGLDMAMHEDPIPKNNSVSLQRELLDYPATHVTHVTGSTLVRTAPSFPMKRLCPWRNYDFAPRQGMLEDVIKGAQLPSEMKEL